MVLWVTEEITRTSDAGINLEKIGPVVKEFSLLLYLNWDQLSFALLTANLRPKS